jgi:hypothetical protein
MSQQTITDNEDHAAVALAEAPTHEHASLFVGDEAQGLRRDWEAVQIAFVDEPRQSVERADALVLQATQRLAAMFAEERARLEEQWRRGEDASTEDLRLALRRYRSFFDRLLAI